MNRPFCQLGRLVPGCLCLTPGASLSLFPVSDREENVGSGVEFVDSGVESVGTGVAYTNSGVESVDSGDHHVIHADF